MSITRRFRNNLALRLKAQKPTPADYASTQGFAAAFLLWQDIVEDVITCIQEDVPGFEGDRFRRAVGAIE